jgi:pimeloyl-ACP methyl ester carboxylesterase
VGWGFTDSSLFASDPSRVIRPEDKVAHLRAFLEAHTDGRPVVLVGASLGGAKALDFAHTYPEVGGRGGAGRQITDGRTDVRSPSDSVGLGRTAPVVVQKVG